MTITYPCETTFYEGIYQLVQKGLTFEADRRTLTITLLGGF